MAAHVEGIFITPKKAGHLEPVESVNAIAGAGLEGDRYRIKEGTLSRKAAEPGRQLTLIESEALERLASEHGIALAPGESRRNVVTRGIALNDLVGKRFRVGAVECVGIMLCDPCGHLEKLTRKGVKHGLDNAGGLRADILVGGQLAVGDSIDVLGNVETSTPPGSTDRA